MSRRILALLTALAALALWPAPASAHAALERSEPPAGARLSESPPALALVFTERLDPALSQVQLFDDQNRLVAEATSPDPADPYALRLPLGLLRDGAYTAIWRVRSAEDGHVTEGTVPFGVGVPAALPSLPPPGAPTPAEAPPPLAAVVARWLTLAAMALLVGPAGFALLAWRPAAAPGPADASLGGALRAQIVAGAWLAVAAVVAELLAQAQAAGGEAGPLSALPGLAAGRGGMLLGARLALAALIGMLAERLPPPAGGQAGPWWLVLGLGAPLTLTLALSGHAASAGAAAIAAAWAHTLAMALWLGGLPALLAAVAIARRQPASVPLGALMRRFSTVALVAVAALAASGAVAALVHIGELRLLTATTYGRALLAKSALFAGLIAFGALHLLVVQPRISAGGPWARRLRLTLGLEAALGAAAILVTAALTSSPPARAAWAAQEQLGSHAVARVDDVGMALWVTPGVAGDNLLAVDLDGAQPGAPAAEVLLRMSMPAMQMGVMEEELAPAEGGRYELRGSHLTMAGRWEVEAIVRRSGRADLRHTFVVDVRAPQAGLGAAPGPAQHGHGP